ncbi:MAG TPA: hypothetical protein VK599_01815 [Streptosporangiaceae bacterium]|nr:hypothetical protein [Streptosporangiaceae bacterium]
MSTEHQITKKAADGTLTIGELREFLAEFDRLGAPGSASPLPGSLKPKVRAGFSGGIKSISVTIPGGGGQK